MTLKLANNRLPILTIFLADVNFQFFVSGGSASSEMTTMSVPKVNWGQPSKRDRKAPKNSFSVSKWPYMIRKRASFRQVGLALQYHQDWLTLKISWPGSWISLRIIEQIFCLPTSFSYDPLSSDKYWSALSLPLQASGPPPTLGSPGLGRGGCLKTRENTGIAKIGLTPPPSPHAPNADTLVDLTTKAH